MALDYTKLAVVAQAEGYKVYMYWTNDTIATLITDGYFDGSYGYKTLNAGDVIIAMTDMDGTPYPCLLQVSVGGSDVTVVAGPPTAAASISIADAGGFTSQTEVEAALQEIYQHLVTAQGVIPVPLTALTAEDGTVLAKLSGTTSGWSQIGNKEVVLSMPINADTEAFQFTVPVPMDLDDSKDIKVCALVSKDADNDTLTLDCEVFPCAAGDLQNADIQDTAAQAIVAAGTVLEFTCGADGVLAAPGTLTAVLTLGGTNDGDAVYIHGVWIKYTKKLLTS